MVKSPHSRASSAVFFFFFVRRQATRHLPGGVWGSMNYTLEKSGKIYKNSDPYHCDILVIIGHTLGLFLGVSATICGVFVNL